MSRREQILVEHRAAIRAVAARRRVRSISLIGSVARGDDTDASDFDFLADFLPGASLFDQAGLIGDLEELLGRSVDVVSAGVVTESGDAIHRDAILL